ncbi:putative toxin-antitoxin system toxin component, PIN family [Chroococcidiopsis sp. CCMEE 29]|uniref:putative toxin-antitoxin system toxin component, PIN family n=1 Tax=Chroococcidiopsis sp. CCMEE 29 TaxID=155894 RepID=UPI0020217EFB|nr:putative toxin-antitoxin system toxin component, PIN family [Chroococcidiopsis sp. CCMEE 29]
MIKVVLDTSVFIAALLSKSQTSTPVLVLNSWRGQCFTLVMAPQLLRELVVKLMRKQVPQADIEDLVTLIAEAALHISGTYEATRLDDIDPDDNIFLAAAYEAKADYLVSLDRQHLLPLKHYHGTQILTPALFIRVIKAAASDQI